MAAEAALEGLFGLAGGYGSVAEPYFIAFATDKRTGVENLFIGAFTLVTLMKRRNILMPVSRLLHSAAVKGNYYDA